jgi:hypothetical protein
LKGSNSTSPSATPTASASSSAGPSRSSSKSPSSSKSHHSTSTGSGSGSGSGSNASTLKPIALPGKFRSNIDIEPQTGDLEVGSGGKKSATAGDRGQAGSGSGGGNGDKQSSVEEGAYLKSRLWWCGLGLIAIGEGGNFLSYGFAPASVVAPLGTVVSQVLRSQSDPPRRPILAWQILCARSSVMLTKGSDSELPVRTSDSEGTIPS